MSLSLLRLSLGALSSVGIMDAPPVNLKPPRAWQEIVVQPIQTPARDIPSLAQNMMFYCSLRERSASRVSTLEINRKSNASTDSARDVHREAYSCMHAPKPCKLRSTWMGTWPSCSPAIGAQIHSLHGMREEPSSGCVLYLTTLFRCQFLDSQSNIHNAGHSLTSKLRCWATCATC